MPISFSSPPMMKLGRSPASDEHEREHGRRRRLAVRARDRRRSGAEATIASNISARASTGIPRRRASASSMLVSGDGAREGEGVGAGEVLGPVADHDLDAAGAEALDGREALMSLPVTWWPMAASTAAMALMPAPPTPTTWMWRGSRGRSAPCCRDAHCGPP